jgi:hypothetical protein
MPAYVDAGMVGALMSYEHAAKRKRSILTVLHRSTEKSAPRGGLIRRAHAPGSRQFASVRLVRLVR